MASPVPQPAKLRVLKGNGVDKDVAGRRVRPQPMAVPQVPVMPDWLPQRAAEMWQRVTPELKRLQLVSSLDLAALEGFCVAYARWRDAQDMLAQDGLTQVGQKGEVVRHPCTTIAKQFAEEMRYLAVQLGLTPAARLRMTLPEVTDDEEEAVFGRAPARRRGS